MKVSAKQYAQALHEIMEGKNEKEVNAVIEEYVLQVKKNGHLKIAQDIIVQYEKIYNAANGIISAIVTSAFPLDAAQKKDVETFIAAEYDGTKVSVVYKEDEDVKGGIIVRVGDEVLDASVNGRLKAVSRALLNN